MRNSMRRNVWNATLALGVTLGLACLANPPALAHGGGGGGGFGGGGHMGGIGGGLGGMGGHMGGFGGMGGYGGHAGFGGGYGHMGMGYGHGYGRGYGYGVGGFYPSYGLGFGGLGFGGLGWGGLYGLGGYGLGYYGLGGYGLGYGLGLGGYGYPGYGYGGYLYPGLGYYGGLGWGGLNMYPYATGYGYMFPGGGFGYSSAYGMSPSTVSSVPVTNQRYLGINEEPAVASDGTRGMRITRIFEGMPAAQAGLQVGDILESANGYRTEVRGNLAWIIANATPSNELKVIFHSAKDGKRYQVTANVP